MVARMSDSENAQFGAMARFIKANGLDGALRTHDWARFAAGYNGPNYRINNYDTRLAAVFAQVSRGALPDLRVRAAQIYLTFLGYDPHGVDGIMGRMTRAALNDYQAARSSRFRVRRRRDIRGTARRLQPDLALSRSIRHLRRIDTGDGRADRTATIASGRHAAYATPTPCTARAPVRYLSLHGSQGSSPVSLSLRLSKPREGRPRRPA
jgi:hypothetical protein